MNKLPRTYIAAVTAAVTVAATLIVAGTAAVAEGSPSPRIEPRAERSWNFTPPTDPRPAPSYPGRVGTVERTFTPPTAPRPAPSYTRSLPSRVGRC